MATDPTTLPSVADLQQAKRDMGDIKVFNVSQENEFTDNQGFTKKTLKGIEYDTETRVSQVLIDLGINGIKVLTQLSTEPLPDVNQYGEGQPLIFTDTLEEYTLIGDAWVEDGQTGNEVDVTAASHLTLAQAQASNLKEGQYVRLTDKDMCLCLVKNSIGVHSLGNGLWLHIAEQQDWVSPECYKNDSNTMDEAFALAVNDHNTKNKRLRLNESYPLNNGYTLYGNINVECAKGQTTLDFSTNPSLSGYGLTLGTRSETALPQLSSDIKKQDTVISFSSDHNLQVGDYIAIYNPTDGSFSSFRPAYKAGEFCKVNDIISTTEVQVDAQIVGSYNIADVQLYKMTKNTLSLKGKLHVKSEGNKSNVCGGVRLERVFESDITGLSSCFHDAEAAIGILQCKDLSGTGLVANQTGSAPTSGNTDYGIAILNSQDLDLQGYFSASRHGVTHGGGVGIGSVPCRRVAIKGVAKTHGGTSTVLALDWHGNAEQCSFTGDVLGGVNLGGDNNRVSGRVVGSKSGLLAYGSEMLGFNFDLSNVSFETTRANDNIGNRGVFDIGGDNQPLSSSTVRGGCLDLSNTKWKLTGATTNDAIRIRNWGCVQERVVNLSGAQILDINDSLPRLMLIDTISGTDVKQLSLTDLYTDRSLPSIVTGVENISGPYDSGSETLTLDTSTNIVEVNVVFDKEFARTPEVTATVNQVVEGSGVLWVQVDNESSTGFRLRMRRTDLQNFQNNIDRRVTWFATL